MNEIFLQAIYYAIVLFLGVLCVGALFKGFFWKYLKVRTGLGKYVMVKVRDITKDYYCVGWIDENFLIYKDGKNKKRLAIKNKNCFYRSLNIVWVDVDCEKNAICNADYSVVTGYDAVKIEQLYNRALFKPAIKSTKDTIVILLLVGILFIAVIGAYLSFMGYNGLGQLSALITNVLSKGTVVSTGAI